MLHVFQKVDQAERVSNEQLLPLTDVARRLGISRQRLHTLISNSQIKALRLGRYYYVTESEIEAYQTLPQGKPYTPRSTSNNSIDKYQ